MDEHRLLRTDRQDPGQGGFASDVQRLLLSLVRGFSACERCCVAQSGVTVAQGNAMLSFGNSGSTTMRELSETAGLAPSTMTRTVDQLVAAGLVNRYPGIEDRREVIVELTPQGQETRRVFEGARRQLTRLVLDRIPPEEHEIAVSVLRRLDEAIAVVSAECGQQDV